MLNAWLALQIVGMVAVVAAVVLLAGVAWALLTAGMLAAVVGEMKG